MNKTIILIFAILVSSLTIFGQVAFNSDGSAPDNSAMLDVKSNTKGVLFPRMTSTERDDISSAIAGLIIFNTTSQVIQVYNGSFWLTFTKVSCAPAQPGSITGNASVVENTTGEVYSITAVDDATSYNWTVPGGATITNGQGTISITVDFSTTSGNISVRAESGCGVSTYTDLSITLQIPPFACGNQFSDSRDGQSYNTILIGSQCWMTENLNVGTMVSYTATDNGVVEKLCYHNDPNNCDIYGGLYPWNEMMDYSTTEGVQGICPEGWHIPSDNDWKILEGTVDNVYGIGNSYWNATGWRGSNAGGMLKEGGYAHWSGPNNGATNAFGFTALPGGLSHNPGSFSYLHFEAEFWTSTFISGTNSYWRAINYNYQQIYRAPLYIGYAASVRCVKD